jgi:hypothetical protein
MASRFDALKRVFAEAVRVFQALPSAGRNLVEYAAANPIDFDGVAKSLARGTSRREVLRRLGVGLVGLALATAGVSCNEDVVGPHLSRVDLLHRSAGPPMTCAEAHESCNELHKDLMEGCQEGFRDCLKEAHGAAAALCAPGHLLCIKAANDVLEKCHKDPCGVRLGKVCCNGVCCHLCCNGTCCEGRLCCGSACCGVCQGCDSATNSCAEEICDDPCHICNPANGQCEKITCPPDETCVSGQCRKCGICEELKFDSDGHSVCAPKACANNCQHCDPATGNCAPVPCPKCQSCNPSDGECRSLECPPCETCNSVSGVCEPVVCHCGTCDPQTSQCSAQCEPCKVCDANGACVNKYNACYACTPGPNGTEVVTNACKPCESCPNYQDPSGVCVPFPCEPKECWAPNPNGTGAGDCCIYTCPPGCSCNPVTPGGAYQCAC